MRESKCLHLAIVLQNYSLNLLKFGSLIRSLPFPALGANERRMSIIFWIFHCPGALSKKEHSCISPLDLIQEKGNGGSQEK